MFGYVAILHIWVYLKKFNILIEGKERPAKTKLFPAKLRTELDTFGSAVNCWLRAVLYCAVGWSVEIFFDLTEQGN